MGILKEFNNFINKCSTNNDIDDEITFYKFCNNSLRQALENHITTPITYPTIPQELIEKIKFFTHKLNKYDELSSLIDTLGNYIGYEHLITLLYNIESLQIEYTKNIYRPISDKTLGSYSYKQNKIYIYTDIFSTLSHEFIHMASAKKISEDGYSIGFSISNPYGIYFNGLNEGYTQLLNERIFDLKSVSYKANTKICKLLELMFDDYRDMEIAYFHNNTDLFIETFLSYGTKEELVYICEKLDLFASVTYEINELNELMDVIYQIIKRKGEVNKIKKCKEIIQMEKQPKGILKRLVKRNN